MIDSRRYIKRVWRVPKDRGAPAYLAALIVKALVKHGWPARAIPAISQPGAFQIEHIDYPGAEAPYEFWRAVDIATRIVARTHRLDVDSIQGFVRLNRPYRVTASGMFKEEKHDLTG